MRHPVAPGAKGYNLLSKRHLFRVVLMKCEAADPERPLFGPLVLESKDKSYYFQWELEDAVEEGDFLIFDTYLKDRDKEYACYFRDHQKGRFCWSKVPRTLVDLAAADTPDASGNTGSPAIA
jgi:hypothetical protein